MYRFLLSRQWVILTLVVLALIPTMIELGFWQLHRHERRVALNHVIAESLAAEPVPVESLTSPGAAVQDADLYRRVTAQGRFDTADEVVVRRRTNADDKVGYHVLTPFVLTDGKVLLVNRGWVPSDGLSQTAFPKIPAPPRGEITVTGRLMPDQTTAESGIKNVEGLPDRQIMLIDSEREGERLGRQVLGGYVELTEPEPQGDTPELIPAPDHDSIGNHMAYAIQWWLFSAGVPVGWVILVRREARDRAQAAAEQQRRQETAPAPV
ncbi:SURF1 family cytochrome oxidase biogenesis protein [Streptomyces chromofuscus]|uniref:SURF1-like protein n=1 Tax=Streptomyces chromofuscus TaxID=42881 RepID=A0A7M2TBK4_STRCW|nr:SURF1 family protein [Streptomyces chromofuscus]QOV45922.1 SURF1 family protein [Streptomyces chromofuscus]GGT39403.1 SURF1-like protein [Streptomyces chromofuscus]